MKERGLGVTDNEGVGNEAAALSVSDDCGNRTFSAKTSFDLRYFNRKIPYVVNGTRRIFNAFPLKFNIILFEKATYSFSINLFQTLAA
jgi:hypothetical protein